MKISRMPNDDHVTFFGLCVSCHGHTIKWSSAVSCTNGCVTTFSEKDISDFTAVMLLLMFAQVHYRMLS